MSTKYLGNTLDFHGGGQDLIFPHHENELVQSECANGAEFVRYWMHNGLLNLRGQKMSKSTGHFFAMDDVLAEFSGEVVRFYLMSTHFRSQMEYSRERLEASAKTFERLSNACRSVAEHLARLSGAPSVSSPVGAELVAAAAKARAGFKAAMDDDFNSAGAIGQMFELIKTYNTMLDEHGPAVTGSKEGLEAVRDALGEFDTILGFFPHGLPTEGAEVPDDIARMVDERVSAKKNKDFQTADRIRDSLLAAGWVLEDTPGGVRVKRK
jgi:cysteinyl-tRNA synthetase